MNLQSTKNPTTKVKFKLFMTFSGVAHGVRRA